jgi:hypothetical protein
VDSSTNNRSITDVNSRRETAGMPTTVETPTIVLASTGRPTATEMPTTHDFLQKFAKRLSELQKICEKDAIKRKY